MPLVLDSATATKHIERERQGYGFTARGPKDKMRLTIAHRWSAEKPGSSWEDQAGAPLERRLREVAAAIVVFAEQAVRHGALSAHTWQTEPKAELEEAERKRRAEEERRRRDRLAKLEKARVDHLLGQSLALYQAQQIRAYVEAVRILNAASADPMAADDLEDLVKLGARAGRSHRSRRVRRVQDATDGGTRMSDAERPFLWPLGGREVCGLRMLARWCNQVQGATASMASTATVAL